MHTLVKGFGAMLLLLVASCVTINIYFPASAAEKVADEIIEDIQTQNGNNAAPADQPQSENRVLPSAVHLALSRIGGFLISEAQAAEADLSIDSPAIRKLQASMKSRFGSLKPFYDQGAVGFTSDALIAIRDAKVLALKDRALVNKLVAAENSDRNALYKAIAAENGHPEWEADVRETFARRWVANAQAGWWYQAGGWKQK